LRLPQSGGGPYTATIAVQGGSGMATFNRIFSTERLLQIIVVLGATVIMKLMS
jgi:hypothetical protein